MLLNKKPRRKDERGISLVEVIIATTILVAVGAGIAQFAPNAMVAVNKAKANRIATTLASTALSEVTSHPYSTIPLTPDGPSGNDYFNPTSPIGTCDCSTVNFDYPGGINSGGLVTSSQTIVVGGFTYLRQTCVNYLQKTALGWQSSCGPDTGLKQVVTHLAWQVGNEWHSLTMHSLSSPPSALAKVPVVGSFPINVCEADGAVPPGCSAVYTNIQNAEVALYNNSSIAENDHYVDPLTHTVNLSALPGPGYQIHAQLVGYFPYNSIAEADVGPAGYTVNADGTVTPPVHTVILRKMSTYGSTLVGEAFVADHPVITRVIDGFGQFQCASAVPPQCNNASEAIEIYNPTPNTYTIGTGPGQFTLQFCSRTTCWPQTEGADFTAAANQPGWTKLNKTLAPYSYYLIVGRDTALPAGWPALGSANIEYKVDGTDLNVPPPPLSKDDPKIGMVQ